VIFSHGFKFKKEIEAAEGNKKQQGGQPEWR
jgi:hypothetical protein